MYDVEMLAYIECECSSWNECSGQNAPRSTTLEHGSLNDLDCMGQLSLKLTGDGARVMQTAMRKLYVKACEREIPEIDID